MAQIADRGRRMGAMSGSVISKPVETVCCVVRVAIDPHRLTAAQFLRLGAASVVYLRPCTVEGDSAYAVHGADGALMNVVEDFDTAMVLAFENGMAVVAVH
jgi:hypothetical protein